ncbi:unnamed protein product [Rotaria socialis]|uniref:Uncharacterized protein n=1 Tax=Rotaria socialis TaxID=392032 RepID=A0A818FBU5_9BILA|nr:unnamed protein product [Rotaria socialis]CAF3694138.1 unnamed protein product [Rotaria socialis]CAF3714486.1 unnamed protein product [Rotaria socialis]CAF4212641.1 unnamed protein product [Rotaria socialis]CAF4531882.1 unnamed protein product [Rotaria socialis]
MKKRHKSKAAQLAAERDIELYIRLDIEDQIVVEEHVLRNAIGRAINILFGEIGSQSIHVELISFRYGTGTIRTKTKMLNQVRCALTFYGLHDKRECAFRIDTKSEENDNDDDEDDRTLSMSMD